MNPTSKKVAVRKRAFPIVYTILRLLVGFGLLCPLILPCIIVISEGSSWSDWLDIAEEAKNFFGNWTSAWLLIGFMASLPLLGMYLIVEACVSFRCRSILGKAT